MDKTGASSKSNPLNVADSTNGDIVPADVQCVPKHWGEVEFSKFKEWKGSQGN
jgi:hypothetical protein